MDFKETKDILIKFAKEVVKNSKKELRSKRASGKLEGSIGYDLNVMPNSFSLEFFMLDYGKFIDAGVDGNDGLVCSCFCLYVCMSVCPLVCVYMFVL